MENQLIPEGTAVSVIARGEHQGFKGIVRGISSNGVPILGRGYIVELSGTIPGYDYSSLVVFETNLRVI